MRVSLWRIPYINQVPGVPPLPYFGMHLPTIPPDAPASPKGVIFN